MDGRVLLVDDDPRVLQLLRDLLLHDGYTVSTASDGEEGLRTFKPGLFDAVVTDVKMPKMDGIEMMKAIKALDPTVEVIVLTGYGTFEMTIDVLRHNGYDFLRKPDEVPQRIRSTVQRAIEKRRLWLKNQELVHALEQANATLEARVLEKTAALEQANRQLESSLLTLGEINQRLRESSFIDDATGLFNHQYFEQRLVEDVARAKRYHWSFALVVFEFTGADNQHTGTVTTIDDQTLRWIADMIKIHLREGDLVARYDDHRFVLMLPQATDEADQLCQRLTILIKAQCDAQPELSANRITAQFGIVLCPEDARSADMLLIAMERTLDSSPPA